MHQILQSLKTAALGIDRAIETFAVSAVALMTLIVTMQVFTRKLFGFVFFWSEELTLLLLIWFSFLGIAIGFREKLHLAMDTISNRLSRSANRLLDIVIGLSTFAFGLYLIKYGWDFTKLMHPNRMSATEWPSSVMYVVMPITGVLVCIYALLQLLGINTVRHKELDEELME
ncbi:TRAP transporter small permease [Paenibacillus jiagnxiensis]|uniref:TRAP transporter small permease n=1 Tax=Paenibacillus jiagnxiensis TaxID=3228926 RepID=UPI0033AC738A